MLSGSFACSVLFIIFFSFFSSSVDVCRSQCLCVCVSLMMKSWCFINDCLEDSLALLPWSISLPWSLRADGRVWREGALLCAFFSPGATADRTSFRQLCFQLLRDFSGWAWGHWGVTLSFPLSLHPPGNERETVRIAPSASLEVLIT